MTITKKHQTEYNLIIQAIDELTRITQRIESLEAAVEEYRRNEEALRKSEIMYRKVIEQLPQRLIIKDVNLDYIFCNEAYAQDLNIKPEKIRGKNIFDFYPLEMAVKLFSEEEEILSSGVPRMTEEKHFVSGQELAVFATKTPVRDDQGEIIGLQVVLQDITEDKRRAESHSLQLKNLEEQVVQEKMKNDALLVDLEVMTTQRNQLQTEIEDMQEKMKREVALLDEEREKLREDLQRETAQRKEAVERLRTSFMQIQDLVNSVHSLMGLSDRQDQ